MKEFDKTNGHKTNIGYVLFVIFLFFAMPRHLRADNSGVGYHGAPFLKVSPAARQVAMGGAFSALTEDINLMRYNVGALGGLQHPSLAVNFNDWIDDTQQGNLAIGLPFKFGTFGFDVSYFNAGKITALNENFIPTGEKPLSGDFLMSFGFGKFFPLGADASTWKLGFGVAAKYLSQNLVGEISSVTAIDAGAQLFFPTLENENFPIISLGAGMQNYGLSDIKFDSWESPLPQTYRFGAALDFQKFPLETWNLVLASDASWTTKEQIRYQLGSELLVKDGAFNNVLSLRAGYKFNDASVSNWAAGFGVYIPTSWLGNSIMRLDYAFAPLTAFEDDAAHRFSLHFAFGAADDRGRDQVSPEDLAALEGMAAKQDSLDAALKAAREAEERLRALEQEMRERLERIQGIAEESEGKIEVEALPEDERKILVTMRINFDFDKANIRPDEYETMEQVGEILNTYPEAQVQLSGHTDWIGTDHYNIHLSHRRIDSVMAFLSMKENVSAERFYMPVGYGESRPIATNETDEGRFRNRRVEFLLFTYDAQPEMPVGTAIKDIRAVNSNTIEIVGNGIIPLPTDTMSLTNPQRFVMDFQDIYFISKQKEFNLNAGPVLRARAAEHIEENYTRVVLDVSRPIDPRLSVSGNKIIIKF